MRYSFDRLHIAIVLSEDPETKYFSSSENTRLNTFLLCPVRVVIIEVFFIF